MAITSTGIGSGLDVQGLVSQLVSAERSPAETRLTRQESSTRSTLSALGIFKATMSGLQSAAKNLRGTSSGFDAQTVTVSKPELFTATAASGAQAGSFSVEVMQLATASKIASGAYASADAVVGNGTVTIGMGSESFNVTLDDSGNTLSALRDRINAASDNPGVTATLLKESGGTRLILTARETGTANALSLSSAAAVGGASYVSSSVVQTAQDAQVKIDGFTYTGSSNTITDAVDGVTLKLLKAEQGTSANLALTADSSAASTAVQNFVKAYNAVVATLSTYGKYDAASKSAGPLMSDATVRSSMQQLRGVLAGSLGGSGEFQVLSQLGITTQADGTLALDATKFDAAMKKDASAVRTLFGDSSNGFATRIGALLDGVLGSGGRLESGTKALQSRLDDLGDQRDRLDLRMAAVEKRYRAQFTSLDTLLGSMQTTSSYLTQQLGNLPSSSSS